MKQDYVINNSIMEDYIEKLHIHPPKEDAYKRVVDVEPKFGVKV